LGNAGRERAVHGEHELADENGDNRPAETVYVRECGHRGAIYRMQHFVAKRTRPRDGLSGLGSAALLPVRVDTLEVPRLLYKEEPFVRRFSQLYYRLPST
jgi:hypothetical protein